MIGVSEAVKITYDFVARNTITIYFITIKDEGGDRPTIYVVLIRPHLEK